MPVRGCPLRMQDLVVGRIGRCERGGSDERKVRYGRLRRGDDDVDSTRAGRGLVRGG